MVPFLIACYLKCVLYDYITSPTLLVKGDKLKGGNSDLLYKMMLLNFVPKYFLGDKDYAKSDMIGFWYIWEDMWFWLLTPLIIMVYLKSSKAFYILAAWTLIVNQVYTFYYAFIMTIHGRAYHRIHPKEWHLTNFWCYLNGVVAGILYCEYALASKMESFKTSYGYRLLYHVQQSEKLSFWILICSICTMFSCFIYTQSTHNPVIFQLFYNIWAGVLILLAMIGKLTIFLKFYGHWLFEIYSHLAYEIYIIHGIILQTMPYTVSVSNQNTPDFYLWLLIKYYFFTHIVALAFKLAVTSPLLNLSQILFGWDIPSNLKGKGPNQEIKVEAEKIEESKSDQKITELHIKQD